MSQSDPWMLWQLTDSAFPSGGFAHSAGLEAARAVGRLADAEALGRFARVLLNHQARAAIPLLHAAHAASDLGAWRPIDRLADATLTNHVAHRASRAMGRALTRAADGAFDHPALAELDHALRQATSPGHLAPTFGYIAGRLTLAAGDAAHLFMFQTLRGAMSAAVRLGIVGPLQAQHLTHQLGPAARDAAQRGMTLRPHDTADTAPLLTLAQTNQDRIYSKLFQS